MKIVNMASVTTPKILESAGKEWVSYGEDNNYFQYLIDRYNGSAVNNAIITGISEQIYGEGLSATDSNRKPLDYAKMRSIFKGEDLKRVAVDYELFGMAAFNIVWNKGKTEILKAKHLPMQNLRPEKAEEGEVKAWFYSDDWTQHRKQKFTPRRIEAFTGARGEETQVMVLKRYASGFFYFSPVDYQGALQWAEIDEEIGNYHLTNIQQGFAPSMLINFNNGKPTDDEERAIERKVQSKLTGTDGKKVLLSFNDSNDTATTIETINISDASEQYKFLSEEATTKIMVGHRVTSPMLFGIKDSSGLGNNAEELKTASQLFDNTVIKPKQNIILEAINEVLIINGIILNTFFKTLQPIEFVDTEGLNAEETEKETGIKMSKAPFLSDELGDELLDELEIIGEENDAEEWELISEELVDTTQEGFHQFANATKSDAKPNEKSKWGDVGLYKVRYAYTKTSQKTPEGESRKFCVRMLELASGGSEYRYEDIKAMSAKGVNSQFSPKGASFYDLFLYSGGVNCYHGWLRRIYFRKKTSKGRFLPNEGLKNDRRVGNAPFIKQKGKESIAPIDTPNKGRKN